MAHSFTSAYFAKQQTDIQKQELDIRKKKFASDLYLQQREVYEKNAGDVEYAEWYAKYGHDPVAAVNAPLPANPFAAQRAAGFKVSASQTEVARQYANDIAEFNKRLAGLPGDLRAGFYGKVQGAPSPMQWEALGVAEQTAMQRAQTQAEQELRLKESLTKERRLAEIAAVEKGKVAVAEVNAANKTNPAVSTLERELAQAEVELAGLEALERTQPKGAGHKINTLGQNVGAMIEQKKAQVKALKTRLNETQGISGSEVLQPASVYDEFDQFINQSE